VANGLSQEVYYNMKREPFVILRGLGLFLALWAAAVMAVRLQLLFPRSVIVWLSQSPNPQQALIAFGALFGSGALAVLRLGIEAPGIKVLVTSEIVRTYIAGVPLWVLGTIFAVSVGALWLVFPACQPPAFVAFRVEGRAEAFHPNDTLIAEPGEFLAITAEAIQKDSILSCKWQYIGEAFETIGTSAGCEINLKLSGKPGDGLLTLQASQNFCNQSSVFSLGIQAANP
jgi:hypothetical protein